MSKDELILSKLLAEIDAASNIEQKELNSEKNRLKETEAFQFDFDYHGFPLSGLEIIESDGFHLINIRLTISYSKDKYKSINVYELINEFNSTSICVKAFYMENHGEDSFEIVYNTEDVLMSQGNTTASLLDKKIELLVSAPRRLHKKMDN